MNVLNKNGEIEKFRPNRIKNKIISETGLNEEEVEKIKLSVVSTIYKNYEDEVDTNTIRSLINAQLVKRGLIKEESKSRKLGMSVADFEDLIEQGCQDNANIGYSPEMIAKYAYDSIAKEYALLTMPKDCREAYINGYVHHHDMEYYNTRSNCFNHDLRFIARNGLKIDGKGDMGSVAKPAKSLEVLLNHMLQTFMAGATVLSGGQGYVNFNTLLAPFCRGRTYDEIKQAIQGFIYNCNMSLIARGGQICFTSISLDMSVPDVLKDEPAVTFGGIEQGTYKDYQEEADFIFRAVLEVSSEKDGQGGYHRFPNILINIREHDLDEYTGNCKLLHELGANNPTLYYTNCTGVEKTIMGCFGGDEKVYCSFNGEERYYTFEELDNLIGAYYGVTDVSDRDIKYLSVDENNNLVMVKPEGFVKNSDRKLYHVCLSDSKEFYCDDVHDVINAETGERINVFDAFDEQIPILSINKKVGTYTSKIKAIHYVSQHNNTYCFDGNGKIVVGENNVLTANCRTSNLMNYREDYEEDCMNTGNFMYSTLNLELMALDSESEQDFYDKLDYYCEIVYNTLHDRREKIEDILYNKHMSDFLLQKDKKTDKPLYELDRLSYTIGFCGLNETLEVLYGKNIIEDIDDGVRIVEYLNEKAKEFHDRDGWRWGVIGSPAESTAYKFGEINRKKYPKCPIQGVEGSYYVTNSHHIPVSANVNIDKHIRNAEVFHKLCGGGCLLHIWSGEVYSDPKSIWSLNKKILAHNVQFWAYSKVFTYCRECGFTINEEVGKCPICKSKDLRVYDRCFSGDTFIYIRKGKIIKPVTLKDFVENYNVTEWEVPVFDYKTQSYVWSKVKRGIKNPPEEMINIKFNKGYEVTCTPNHNFYDYKTYSRKKSMYDTVPAKDLNVKSKIINHRCPKFLDDMSEDYLGTFIGFVLGDGCVVLQENGKNVFIRLRFYKEEKSDYCKTILDKNNLKYTFSEDNIDKRNNSKIYSYYIGANNVGNKAYDMFNKTHGNKKAIIDECYNQDLFVGIFAGLINSDGSVLVESRKNSIVTTFNQVDKDILWLFYNIALLLGTNPSISFTGREGYEPVGKVEITSLKAYEILNKIILRSSFDKALEKGKCISDAKSVNGMCTVSAISEDVVQNSYCIETEHEGHNTLFNGILSQNCTGYYLPRDTFNKGKLQEQKERYRLSI